MRRQTILAGLLVPLICGAVWGQQQKAKRLDVTKRVIERPVELDVLTRDAREALEREVARRQPQPKPENPKVEPGKVRWHQDLAAACAAAKKSGKPVLLFQMMGNLDERFC